MSSTYLDNTISNCLDGITTTATFCHSGNAGGDYIVITIAGDYYITKVVVYNRGNNDAEINRIKDNRLKYSKNYQGSSIIYQTTFSGTSQLVYTFKFPTYLRINRPNDGYFICMAEIELYTSSNVKIPTTGYYYYYNYY